MDITFVWHFKRIPKYLEWIMFYNDSHDLLKSTLFYHLLISEGKKDDPIGQTCSVSLLNMFFLCLPLPLPQLQYIFVLNTLNMLQGKISGENNSFLRPNLHHMVSVLFIALPESCGFVLLVLFHYQIGMIWWGCGHVTYPSMTIN